MNQKSSNFNAFPATGEARIEDRMPSFSSCMGCSATMPKASIYVKTNFAERLKILRESWAKAGLFCHKQLRIRQTAQQMRMLRCAVR